MPAFGKKLTRAQIAGLAIGRDAAVHVEQILLGSVGHQGEPQKTAIRGIANALGWVNVAIYLLLGLGYAYFQFMKPSAA